MSTAISAQGSQLKIATGSGSALTVSGITVGYPTIITSTAHGQTNGASVAMSLFTGTDSASINGLSFTILYKTTNTFAIALDSTGMTISHNSSAARATPSTYTAVANFDSFNGFDGSASVIDKTDFDSTAKEFMLGLVDNGNLSVNFNEDDSDTGQLALEAARVGGLRKHFKVILPAGSTPNRTFYGYVMKISMAGSVDQKVTRTADIKIDGAVTWS